MFRQSSSIRLLNFLLTFAGCLFVSTITFAQEQELWRKDWLEFGVAIAPYAREGVVEKKADFAEFNRIFSKEVEWNGKLIEFHFTRVVNELNFEMQPIQVSLSDGRAIVVKELRVWCDKEQRGCKDWSAELIGKNVIFRTSLINRTSGYLPIVRLSGQRIYIETYGGDLVKVLSK